MSDDRERRIEELFRTVADLPADERRSALHDACDDESLRRDVESRLRSTPNTATTIEDRSGGGGTGGPSRATDRAPDRAPGRARPVRTIGPYRVQHEIGRGGMGLVYLAIRNDDSFKRRVAVKVLKRGMDTEDVLRRFELERQVLAALNHAGIARWYGAGETEDGLPYFVMEFVEGLDLEAYCDTHRLNIGERLELFRKVCAAVHYAHQNLIVHRDLKPSNIIVTPEGEPKLLDFGIAKVIDPDAGAGGEATAPEFRVMTPEYASPEQMRGGPITTASDVYALGVLLYELVCGHSPYRLTGRDPAQLERAILESEPERPSTAVGQSATAPPREDPTGTRRGGGTTIVTPEAVGKAREIRPDRLRRRLAGDVDNIVLMAMRKEPDRRYGSAEELSEDIDRHLRGLPVRARSDTLGYRFTTFVRRHRAGVAAAVILAVALVASTLGTALAWRGTQVQRDAAVAARQAEADLRVVAEADRDRARRRFDQLRGLARAFMFDFHALVAGLDGSDGTRALMVATALEYLDTLAAEAGDDVELLRELANAYEQVGDIRRDGAEGDAGALESYRAAGSMREKLAAADPGEALLRRDLARSHRKIGDLLRRGGDLSGALAAHRAADGIAQTLVAADPGRAAWAEEARLARVDLVETLRGLAALTATLGDTDRAIEHLEEARRLLEEAALAGPDDLGPTIEAELARLRGRQEGK